MFNQSYHGLFPSLVLFGRLCPKPNSVNLEFTPLFQWCLQHLTNHGVVPRFHTERYEKLEQLEAVCRWMRKELTHRRHENTWIAIDVCIIDLSCDKCALEFWRISCVSKPIQIKIIKAVCIGALPAPTGFPRQVSSFLWKESSHSPVRKEWHRHSKDQFACRTWGLMVTVAAREVLYGFVSSEPWFDSMCLSYHLLSKHGMPQFHTCIIN